MTEEEKRRLYEEAVREHHRQQQELQAKLHLAHRRAIETQQEINNMPRRRYCVIAAVDESRGFAKDGKIPWHYKEDFAWFKARTTGHACVMGRTTYEDIVSIRGDAAKDSVLPDRKCFVVSRTLDPATVTNATVIRNFWEASEHLNDSDEDLARTIFFIGGDKIFRRGISIADTVFLTVINKQFDCDKFFPTEYLDKYFTIDKVFQNETAPDLRFLMFKRTK